jgi:AbrB family looped-hinge helix DNA binding protein
MYARVSNKGQVTIPVGARRKVGIEPNSLAEVTVTGEEVTIRPVTALSTLAGALREHARPGEKRTWDDIRAQAESSVAGEVAGAHARRVRGRR